jgi:hypothetical protein
MGRRYFLEDFNTILFKGEPYVLPAEMTVLLVELESQLDITDPTPVVPVPVFRKPANPKHRQKGGAQRREEDWQAVRDFKATKIEAKVGIEKTVNELRIALNKMSTANYEKQRDAIMVVLESADFDGEGIQRISKAIFDIASTNKFYSDVYANLYAELSTKYVVFMDLLSDFVSHFSENAEALSYVDPDVDYDGYCVYTKACDKRKSTTTFIVSCLKRGLVPNEKVAKIVLEKLAFIEKCMVEEGKTKEVEEVVENLFIAVTQSKDQMKSADEWSKVLDRIRILSKTKGRSQLSWSNRAAFKMLDLVEII